MKLCWDRWNEASVVHGTEKGIAGVLDDSKDQVSSDSSIPLSPQWLYSKPVDSKATANPVGVVLKDIWNGKITSSEVLGYSFRGKDGGLNDDISVPGTTLSERKQTLIDGGGKVISGIEISNDFDQIAGSSRNAVNGCMSSRKALLSTEH
ncbi:uncharacterized protein LOC110275738 isoform X2 [Arachis duranensis]|uniref:Uncharacterized protein LOC110275738 isoform X2 n=1 Tax=Arachis duranensis TaxID=130453 RepID=A0A6P5MQQ6_ARADU|nr:uncharacterized protein LOC110275738 isoform X2 [Arachis duranensis]